MKSLKTLISLQSEFRQKNEGRKSAARQILFAKSDELYIFAIMNRNISELAGLLGGRHILPSPQAPVRELLTDSRSLTTEPSSALFFALSTRTNDGHRFLEAMRSEGVRNFVVSRLPFPSHEAAPEEWKECNFIVVDDVLEALQKLGGEARGRSAATVVAITGSQGKTTLKEYLFQALEPLQQVSRSPRSFNSQIGVPLSLARIDAGTQTALIEAGISRPGEMRRLSEIIRPDIAVITNIGAEHDDGFTSREEKAREKALIAAGAKALVYNADDGLSAYAASVAEKISPDTKLIRISRTDRESDLFVESTEAAPGGTLISYRVGPRAAETAFVPFTSPHDIEDCIEAIAVMLLLGKEPGLISWRLKDLKPVSTRLNVADGVNGCQLISDEFTSDLASLRTALDFMKRRPTDGGMTRTLILSDLHHESAETETGDLYEEIAALAKGAGIDRFIGIGKALQAHNSAFPAGSLFFPTVEEMMAQVSTSDFSRELILLKGSAESGFAALRENLEARTHETVLEVNLDAIVKNFNYFRSFLPAGCGLVAMVKATGYGAGSYEIAKTLQDHGAAYLAVAVLDEGIDLRRAGITMPIMVMNPKVVNYKAMFENRLEPEIYCFDMLADVIREARKNGLRDYPVHIKLDTGMHRMGFNEDELPQLVERLKETDAIRPATMFSHLATADCPDMNEYTELQLDRFERYTGYILAHYPKPIKRHILNSAGILRFPEHHYDFARLGIGLYGVNTLPPEMEKPLETVSTLRTVVIAVKERKAGETIGYGRRGVLTRDSRIATIPIGYADGMNRHFGNGHSRVLVNGQAAPTIGNICMDACMIDVTGIDCKPGDSVEIFGPNIPVQELADILDTIPYEVLTSVSPRVKRVYYRE